MLTCTLEEHSLGNASVYLSRFPGFWRQARDWPLHPFLSVLSLLALIKLHSDLPLFCIKEYLFCKILVLTLYIETRNREEGRFL